MLQTRHIFLDTSELVSLNFAYDGPVLSALESLLHKGAAFIHFTDISISEIKAQIESEVHASIQAADQFRKKARILKNLPRSPYKEFFAELEKASAVAELNGQLERFMANTKAHIVSVNAVPVNNVFGLYFRRKAPFGENKKKNEFPDAFTLIALEQWCQENNEKMYVVTHDSDLKTYCQQSITLLCLEKTSDFINLLTFHDDRLAPFIRDLLEKHPAEIKGAIERAFCNLGFYLDDQQGDVLDVTVTDIEITDQALIEVNKDHAVVEITAKVYFNADVEYDDLETATYDSEDKVLIPWRTVNKTVERDTEVTVYVHLNLDLDNPDLFKIADLSIGTGRRFDIAITAEDDNWPYK